MFDFPGKTGLLLVTAALSVIVIAHHYYTRARDMKYELKVEAEADGTEEEEGDLQRQDLLV